MDRNNNGALTLEEREQLEALVELSHLFGGWGHAGGGVRRLSADCGTTIR